MPFINVFHFFEINCNYFFLFFAQKPNIMTIATFWIVVLVVYGQSYICKHCLTVTYLVIDVLLVILINHDSCVFLNNFF